MSTTPKRTADDEAKVPPSDAVEHRAVGAGNVVRNRRAQPDADVKRAESRGIYRDTAGVRRVVGQGQPIPDGWERVEGATVSDRSSGDPRGPLEVAGADTPRKATAKA